ncbi:MAG: hypothetical protein OEZ32_12115 [Nitrospinota bacterium]|nr:hypothetical protein [Nitrospinota bacterium]
MTMHSLYFLSYALILTISGLVMVSAYYSRFKRDGAPVNYGLLAVVFGGALAMWTGVAVTEYVYNPNVINAGFSIVLLATWTGAACTGLANKFSRKQPKARKRPTIRKQYATGSY